MKKKRIPFMLNSIVEDYLMNNAEDAIYLENTISAEGKLCGEVNLVSARVGDEGEIYKNIVYNIQSRERLSLYSESCDAFEIYK